MMPNAHFLFICIYSHTPRSIYTSHFNLHTLMNYSTSSTRQTFPIYIRELVVSFSTTTCAHTPSRSYTRGGVEDTRPHKLFPINEATIRILRSAGYSNCLCFGKLSLHLSSKGLRFAPPAFCICSKSAFSS